MSICRVSCSWKDTGKHGRSQPESGKLVRGVSAFQGSDISGALCTGALGNHVFYPLSLSRPVFSPYSSNMIYLILPQFCSLSWQQESQCPATTLAVNVDCSITCLSLLLLEHLVFPLSFMNFIGMRVFHPV